MKVLLDHNLDRNLKRFLKDHDVSTAQERGWALERNGRLLTLAEKSGFSVLLTADVHIKEQQNFAGRQISVLVLRAPNNRLDTHVTMIPQIENALSTIQPGQIVEIYYTT